MLLTITIINLKFRDNSIGSYGYVGKNGDVYVDLAYLSKNIVNNFDLIHWNIDHLLAILVINR